MINLTERQLNNFWAKVNKTETCWLWTANKDDFGYGRVNVTANKKPFVYRAHRLAYEITVGNIREDRILDHICHNPACVRPDHLRQVTRKQNVENLSGACRNSKSGFRGVFWHKQNRKWRVMVTHRYQKIHVGMFNTLQEANAAAIAKRNELYTHNDVDRLIPDTIIQKHGIKVGA